MMEHSEQLDIPNSRACVVYINGKYWGIYFLKEFIDEEYLQDKFGVDKNDVDIIERWGIARTGSSRNFNELLKLLKSLDMSSETAYATIQENIDIDNMIDYLSIQLFAGNADWGDKNVKTWRSASYDGKWRWLMNDLDMCFSSLGASHDSFEILFREGSLIGEVCKYVFQNVEFRNKFLDRCADLLNSHLHWNRAIEIVDSIACVISTEIDRHKEIWNEPQFWEVELDFVREYIALRSHHLRAHLVNQFDLTAYYSLYIEILDTTNSELMINSIIITSPIWKGYYFNDIPITITAIPEIGYELLPWGNDSFESKYQIDFSADDNVNIFPIFIRKNSIVMKNIVINEIMYKSPTAFDSNDWIELYNPNMFEVDLSGWVMKDDKNSNSFTIPQGTIIEPDGYIVIAENLNEFYKIHHNVENVVGSFSFGLSSLGDQVHIFDKTGRLHDSVQYYSTFPWEPKANATGFSLELIDPSLDNTLLQNWRASYKLLGTPGERNSVFYSLISENKSNNISIYPNPTSDIINININFMNFNKIEIINSSGAIIARYYYNSYFSNSNNIQINCSNLPIGIYFIRLIGDNNNKSISFAIVR